MAMSAKRPYVRFLAFVVTLSVGVVSGGVLVPRDSATSDAMMEPVAVRVTPDVGLHGVCRSELDLEGQLRELKKERISLEEDLRSDTHLSPTGQEMVRKRLAELGRELESEERALKLYRLQQGLSDRGEAHDLLYREKCYID
jgi:hypothetical protein